MWYSEPFVIRISSFDLPVPYPERVYLTGFMGSGKSTVGPILANAIGYGFTDLDEHIERRAGQTIPELFEQEGEAVFRALEAELLRETTERPYIVVALGGGALVAPASRRLARAHGTVIYLHVPVEQLVRRLRRGSADRPLLTDDEGNPLTSLHLRDRVEGMLRERLPLYRDAAHVTVDVGDRRVEDTVEAVLEALRQRAAE